MIRLETKNFNMILTEKQQKYQYYHQNILQAKKILLSDQGQIIEQAKFAYSRLWKTLEKQTKAIESPGEKQIKPIKEHGK